MLKAQALRHWQSIPANQPILPHFTPLAAKTEGRRYGACGIRIDGSPEFIDAVLSRLKDLIAGENHATRLELARRPVDGSGIGMEMPNASRDAECCYIRLYHRGHQGAMASAFFDRHLSGATVEYAKAIGVEVEAK